MRNTSVSRSVNPENVKPRGISTWRWSRPSCVSSRATRSAGTHAFAELRLLATVRTDDLGLDPERLQELDRILGGSGHDAASRLDLDPQTEHDVIRDSTLEALQRWRRVAAHPLSSRPLQLAALGACRTLEEVYTEASS